MSEIYDVDDANEVETSSNFTQKSNQYSQYRDVPDEIRMELENSAKRISRQGKLKIMTKKRISSLKVRR